MLHRFYILIRHKILSIEPATSVNVIATVKQTIIVAGKFAMRNREQMNTHTMASMIFLDNSSTTMLKVIL